MPDCQAMDDSAIAVGSDALGTRLGASALSDGPRNARAVPSRTAMPYNIGRLIRPLAVVQASIAAIAAWTSRTARATIRLSIRSAIQPTSGVSTNSGANCNSPIIPSRAELAAISIVSRAMLYACQPTISIMQYSASIDVSRVNQ